MASPANCWTCMDLYLQSTTVTARTELKLYARSRRVSALFFLGNCGPFSIYTRIQVMETGYENAERLICKRRLRRGARLSLVYLRLLCILTLRNVQLLVVERRRPTLSPECRGWGASGGCPQGRMRGSASECCVCPVPSDGAHQQPGVRRCARMALILSAAPALTTLPGLADCAVKCAR